MMNTASWIVLAVVLLALSAAVAFSVHRRKHSGADCSGCSLKSFCRKD